LALDDTTHRERLPKAGRTKPVLSNQGTFHSIIVGHFWS